MTHFEKFLFFSGGKLKSSSKSFPANGIIRVRLIWSRGRTISGKGECESIAFEVVQVTEMGIVSLIYKMRKLSRITDILKWWTMLHKAGILTFHLTEDLCFVSGNKGEMTHTPIPIEMPKVLWVCMNVLRWGIIAARIVTRRKMKLVKMSLQMNIELFFQIHFTRKMIFLNLSWKLLKKNNNNILVLFCYVVLIKEGWI